RAYAYYRCLGTDAYRFGGERLCQNTQVRTDLLDLAVWQEVCTLLTHPERLAEEYRRRLQPEARAERTPLAPGASQIRKPPQGVARLIDSYAEGVVDKGEFEPRVTRLRQRLARLEEQRQALADEAAMQGELQLIIGRLEDFAAKLHDGLEAADWTSQRDLIRALVKRVEVARGNVNIVFRIDPYPGDADPEKKSLQLCRESDLPAMGQKIAYKANRDGVAERFADPAVHKSIEVALALITYYDELLTDLELSIVNSAKQHDANTFYRLRSIPGVGKILALVMLYEIHEIRRFPSVQDFASYCRLVKCAKESAGKRYGTSGKKIGNAYLKWAFSEAAVLFLRNNEPGQKYLARLEKTHDKGKALTILAHKL